MREKGCKVTQSEYLPYIWLVENVENISELPGFDTGAFTIQDVSSALAVEEASIQQEDFVMDICAAPGGKSILASERARKVLARDVSEAKVAIIEQNLERMQVKNVITQVYDATMSDEAYRERADVLIVDVPCSGLGVIGKKRDIKYHINKEKLVSIVELQKKIVENSWQYVKPGGVLLYSTCTIHRAENQDMVQWIVEQFPFEVESSTQLLPGFQNTDGFFYARLRRKE